MAFINFQPNDYFNTKLYTGTGSSNAQTGVGFQPDWIWLKNRSSSSNHHLVDAVRGITKELRSNLSNSEATDDQLITAFGSDGFTLGTSGSGNTNGDNYASWNWKANGAGSSNTDGSITSTVSASATSGFSIVKYVGTGSNATIGHGLGAVPSVVFVKKTSGTGDWIGYFKALGNTKNARFNTTDAADTNSTVWNSTTPTSSVFSVGTFGETNGSGDTFVAYCFAEKKGFSKFGSYIGNGNADGAFIYTGFKPALFVVKRYDSSGEYWNVLDNKRNPENPADDFLYWSENSAEGVKSSKIDFVSNGIKIRGTDGAFNNSSGSYIYMCFAEEPLVASNGTPATAR